MKIQLFALLTLIFSITTKASVDLKLEVGDLISMSFDSAIEEVIEVRAQLNVFSRGAGLRSRGCYKEYQSNFPFAAQTVPFTVSQNFKVDLLSKKNLSISNLLEIEKRNVKLLKTKIKKRCKADSVLTIFVKGVLDDGQSFKSDLTGYIVDGEILLNVGSLRHNVEVGVPYVLDLIPTVFFGNNWNIIWNKMDPKNDQMQTNY